MPWCSAGKFEEWGMLQVNCGGCAGPRRCGAIS
ncbi:unnamed protein product [Tuber melanosporum]|uniref:(Perigord truffle) hypothetical protein n=1 Tax=Tuber melanosporum (strain Mel28) TaxID=656061 RepID=D5GHH9_TUBMM|nr:uncharacterized protein GSTUM_00007891001 [Tuber melanosporum]CAZ83972.1 unnamed protein product [Tuber melanosporum]